MGYGFGVQAGKINSSHRHNSMNTISVLIPVYNGAAYLAEAIASVYAQTLRPLELIVVDDGSTDASAAIATAAGAQVHRQVRLGTAGAINAGVALAQGGWLAILDADDRWLPDKLERQWAAVQRIPGAARTLFFTHLRQFASPELAPTQVQRLAGVDQVLPGIVETTLLVQRHAFTEVGGYDLRWRVGEFIDWYARAQGLGWQTHVLPEVLAERRLHAANLARHQRDGHADVLRILHAKLRRERQIGAP